MNTFLASIPVANLVDITATVVHGQTARLVFTGMVTYQV